MSILKVLHIPRKIRRLAAFFVRLRPGETCVGRRLAGTLIRYGQALATARHYARDRLVWLLVCAFCALLIPLPTLQATWLSNGNDVSGIAGDQRTPGIMPDGSGGAIVIWSRLSSSGSNSIYAQRISADGDALWGSNGITVCTGAAYERFPMIASDGAGGAFVVWEDSRNSAGSSDIFAQRIALNGTLTWAQAGVPICAVGFDQECPKIIADGLGGAVFVWSDGRGGSGYFDIYAQKIDKTGLVRWAKDGVRISSGQDLFPGLFDAVSDGAGGAIVVWQKRNAAKCEQDIYAQRINQNGVFQWVANGLAVCVATGDQLAPRAARASDGSVVVAWSDARLGSTDIYAQKLSAAGMPQWTAGGIVVCGAIGDQRDPLIVPASSGGVFVAWNDRRSGNQDLYFQKIIASGTPLWAAAGLPLCTERSDQFLTAFVAGATDEAVAVWSDGRNAGFSLFAQKVDGTGSSVWTADGAPACATDIPAPLTCYDQDASSDGAGGVVLAWQDWRSGSPNIFAQRLSSGSNEGVAEGGAPPSAASLALYQNFPNPFNPMTKIAFDLTAEASVSLRVFDASGRLVRMLVDEAVAAGRHEVYWDGKDDSGRRVASGVYFYRLQSGSFTQTKKMVLLR